MKISPAVFAGDLDSCKMNGEPWCLVHSKHYAEWSCVGPHQDEEYDYQMIEGKGRDTVCQKKEPTQEE